MFNSEETAQKIEVRIREALEPVEFELEDQSYMHAGHKSAGGGGHFFVRVKSAKFNGLAPLARQRLVIAAVGTLMDKEVHALSMQCLSE
ncbi:MAG: BolA family protein [Bdellovibrionota bacterium]